MDLKKKLARLPKTAFAATAAAAVKVLHEAPSGWDFVERTTNDGALHCRVRHHAVDAAHGKAPLSRALEAHGDALATLCLDESLGDVDAARLVFLDTETTGLAGGTGTLAFLLGVGYFEGGQFVTEQWFVPEPGAESPALAALVERIESASAIVTYNGKRFDLPLLRDRLVLARIGGLPPRPQVDLLHVARRVYGERMESCSLATVEREVLGFEREGDIPGAEIPERYRAWLATQEVSGMVPVVKHHEADILALAALLGELVARLGHAATLARHDAHDALGLARTAERAGRHEHALLLVQTAVAKAQADGLLTLTREANLVAARIHKRRKDPHGTVEHLKRALVHDPDNAGLHLELAKLYERSLHDAIEALRHAERSHGAEDPKALAKRLLRLRREAAKGVQLGLPGVDLGVGPKAPPPRRVSRPQKGQPLP